MSTAPATKQHYSYADYLRWPEDERWELIDGIPYEMTPSPLTVHQRIVGQLYRQLSHWLDDKSAEVFISPLDVALAAPGTPADQIVNVVEPDIMVVCDPSKIQDRGIMGAPDFIIEVSSPSTARRDEIQKVELYQRFGVREYWIVRPQERLIEIRVLQSDRKFAPADIHSGDGKLGISILPGFECDLDKVFGPREQTLPSPKQQS